VHASLQVKHKGTAAMSKMHVDIEDVVCGDAAASTCSSHTSEYHEFSSTELVRFRADLLKWYAIHNRKLPWRGDSPPFGASKQTRARRALALSSSNRSTKSKSSKKTTGSARSHSKSKQISIKSFFARKKAHKRGSVSTSANAAARVDGSGSTISNSTQTSTKNNSHTEPSDTQTQHTQHTHSPVSTRRNVSAYGVWVSEVMLQQTRVDTVIDYFNRWMDRFPTLHALADASSEVVLAQWAGLGYYRRAKFLHQGAKMVVREFNGKLPRKAKQLLRIPGIGPYTAGTHTHTLTLPLTLCLSQTS